MGVAARRVEGHAARRNNNNNNNNIRCICFPLSLSLCFTYPFFFFSDNSLLLSFPLHLACGGWWWWAESVAVGEGLGWEQTGR
ncbi:hypothetical protein TRSC58_07666 [Trypanosoma rangeli SC58]|uniref:Uncharacterized protein n=1 Tax=Trypanosoma rangeli SC58 TaxID=429131 RepID=A0A061IRQ1_TRYRA|nr:hypothetical protein TRSC58_07666 [Trypanosoma rangeli SC58]